MASNREDRFLMRQRGAVSHKIKDADFGLSFPLHPRLQLAPRLSSRSSRPSRSSLPSDQISHPSSSHSRQATPEVTLRRQRSESVLADKRRLSADVSVSGGRGSGLRTANAPESDSEDDPLSSTSLQRSSRHVTPVGRPISSRNGSRPLHSLGVANELDKSDPENDPLSTPLQRSARHVTPMGRPLSSRRNGSRPFQNTGLVNALEKSDSENDPLSTSPRRSSRHVTPMGRPLSSRNNGSRPYQNAGLVNPLDTALETPGMRLKRKRGVSPSHQNLSSGRFPQPADLVEADELGGVESLPIGGQYAPSANQAEQPWYSGILNEDDGIMDSTQDYDPSQSTRQEELPWMSGRDEEPSASFMHSMINDLSLHDYDAGVDEVQPEKEEEDKGMDELAEGSGRNSRSQRSSSAMPSRVGLTPVGASSRAIPSRTGLIPVTASPGAGGIQSEVMQENEVDNDDLDELASGSRISEGGSSYVPPSRGHHINRQSEPQSHTDEVHSDEEDDDDGLVDQPQPQFNDTSYEDELDEIGLPSPHRPHVRPAALHQKTPIRQPVFQPQQQQRDHLSMPPPPLPPVRTKVPPQPPSNPPRMNSRGNNKKPTNNAPLSLRQQAARNIRRSKGAQVMVYRLANTDIESGSRNRNPNNPIDNHTNALNENENEENEDDDILQTAPKFIRRPNVNAVDVLNQLCRELLDTEILNLKKSSPNENTRPNSHDNDEEEQEKKTKRHHRKTLEAYSSILEEEFFELTSTLDTNHALGLRVRQALREKTFLENDLLRIRFERDQLAHRIEEVKVAKGEREKERVKEGDVEGWIGGVELAVNRGRGLRVLEDEGEGDGDEDGDGQKVEFLLKSLVEGGVTSLYPALRNPLKKEEGLARGTNEMMMEGDDGENDLGVGDERGRGGLLNRIKGFNDFLEKSLGVLP
ncbi:MAG: Pyruvate kinase [Watsoniomyces obsoletus]|nr:MAG: Pyruvate kinase [Watsoniomyces obsoletus]